MRKIYLVICLFAYLISFGQNKSIATLGELIPDYTFDNVLNSNSKKISLKDFRGKPIILEFWATWCATCLPVMKKLEKYQAKFKNQVEIIAVSKESETKLLNFINRKNSSLRIASDNSHNYIFNYKAIPHCILIDKNGVVRAITKPEYVTDKVIQKLINNQSISLPIKDDFFVDVNKDQEVLATFKGNDIFMELKTYNDSKISKSKVLRNFNGDVTGILLSNQRIPFMFRDVYGMPSTKRVIYKDGLTENDFPFKTSNLYNFEVNFTFKYKDNWRYIAAEFLNKNLPIIAKKSKKPFECYILKKTEDILKQSKSRKSMLSSRTGIFEGKKVEISELARYIEDYSPYPVIDQTGLKGTYDIYLDLRNVESSVDVELKKYGLVLEKSKIKLPVDVIEIYRKNNN